MNGAQPQRVHDLLDRERRLGRRQGDRRSVERSNVLALMYACSRRDAVFVSAVRDGR